MSCMVDIIYAVVVKLRQGSGKDGQGWARMGKARVRQGLSRDAH